jgi:hypothetical protein
MGEEREGGVELCIGGGIGQESRKVDIMGYQPIFDLFY